MEVILQAQSVITNIKNGSEIKANKKFEVRGKAWAGELEVSEVYISNDYGVTWIKAKVEKPLNRLAWQKWSTQISIPTKEYYEIGEKYNTRRRLPLAILLQNKIH